MIATDAWEGTAVDVPTIEAAIARLWHGASNGANDHPPARTSVINLVAYVSREDGVDRVSDAIGELTERHPSRTIVVVADPRAPTSSIDARVVAQCGETTLVQERLCWEQVTLTAHGAAALHASSIVTPLLLPELPTYLWWSENAPFGSDLFSRMLGLCDRLIVESSRFARPIDGLAKLWAISRMGSEDRGVSDFNWIRLTPWRGLTAQFFDPPEIRPYAQRIESVAITYARTAGEQTSATTATGAASPSQALLLAGWLASRLGWTPRPSGARRQGDVLQLEADRIGMTVPIRIEAQPSDEATAGHVLSLTLNGTLRDVPGSFTVQRRADDDTATTTTIIGPATPITRTARMATRPLGDLLTEELDVFRHDRVYEDALGAAALMCERLAADE